MAGAGILALKVGSHISKFIICSLLINTSLRVKMEQPSRVSCTKPRNVTQVLQVRFFQ